MSRRPNILILMLDQLNGTLFPDGPAEFLHVPALRALAARSTRFANAYTASPLCAPARAAFMSGQLPSRTRVYDNAAEFASSIPTYAHCLRRVGYRTGVVKAKSNTLPAWPIQISAPLIFQDFSDPIRAVPPPSQVFRILL